MFCMMNDVDCFSFVFLPVNLLSSLMNLEPNGPQNSSCFEANCNHIEISGHWSILLYLIFFCLLVYSPCLLTRPFEIYIIFYLLFLFPRQHPEIIKKRLIIFFHSCDLFFLGSLPRSGTKTNFSIGRSKMQKNHI